LKFAAYCCYGIGIIFAAQAFINIGVNIGLLPTKGLTLPFFSYGGSSLIICFASIGLVLRAQYEQQLQSGEVR
jgi:cell division protein FtsW